MKARIWKLARRLRRLGFEVFATAVVEFKPLSIEGRTPPLLVHGHAVFETLVDKGYNALILCSSGSGFVEAAGRLWHVLDCLHTLIPLPPDTDTVRVVVEPRGFFGVDYDVVYIGVAGLAKIDWDVAKLGLRLLHVADLALYVSEESLRELEDAVSELTPRPEKWQLAIALTTFSCGLDQLCPSKRRRVAGFIIEWSSLEGLKLLRNRHKADTPEFKDAARRLYHWLAEWISHSIGNVQPKPLLVFYSHLDLPWLWPLTWSLWRARAQKATIHALYTLYTSLNIPYHPGLEALNPTTSSQILCSLWVEPDTWLTPPEMLLQMAKECRARGSVAAWLPDSFGYSSQLLPILSLAGLEGIVIHKLAWNDTSKPGFTRARWRNSIYEKPLVHLPYGYGMSCSPAEMLEQAMKLKGSVRYIIYPCGPGDSGSPPTLEDLEGALLAVEAGIAEPLTREKLEQLLREANTVVEGDLYLEYHRGIYTTDSRVKAYLWKLRSKLLALSLLAVLGKHKQSLKELWLITSLLSFHDTVSGTLSNEARRDIYSLASKLVEALESLTGDGKRQSSIVNTLPWNAVHVEQTESCRFKTYIVEELSVASYQDLEYRYIEPTVEKDAVSLGGVGVSVEAGRAHISLDGLKLTVSLSLHPDYPHDWDAWEIDEYSLEKRLNTVVETSLRECLATIRLRSRWGRATVVLRPWPTGRIVIDAYAELERNVLAKMWLQTPKASRAWRIMGYSVAEARFLEDYAAGYEQPLTALALETSGGMLAAASYPPRGVSVTRNWLGISIARRPSYPDSSLAPSYVRIVLARTESVGEAARLYEETVRPPEPLSLDVKGVIKAFKVSSTAPITGSLVHDGNEAILYIFNPEPRDATVDVEPAAIRPRNLTVIRKNGGCEADPAYARVVLAPGELAALMYQLES